MVIMMRYSFLFIVIIVSSIVSAQECCGTTGLMAVPTAETAEAGTFRGGVFYLDDHFTPDQLVCEGEKYNTGGYFISITPWSWIELSYACTLLKMHKSKDPDEPLGYYNEDRRMGLKLRPLKEGKWWPSVAIGADDVEQFIERWLKNDGGTYFQNAYVVASKSFNIGKHELSAHLGYRYFFNDSNRNRRGVAGGIALRPGFYRNLRFMAEWDGVGVNAGADVLLWRHLFLQACLVHGRGFTGGISYHYTIHF